MMQVCWKEKGAYAANDSIGESSGSLSTHPHRTPSELPPASIDEEVEVNSEL